ncbi:hypothetical protein BH11BAC3_BH11BAC3_30970 [soil metagenome]
MNYQTTLIDKNIKNSFMKRPVKIIALVFLMMCFVTSSQEKDSIEYIKCTTEAGILDNSCGSNLHYGMEDEYPLMPITQFILLQ